MTTATSEQDKTREQVRTERDSIRRRLDDFERRKQELKVSEDAAEGSGDREAAEWLAKEQKILSLDWQTFAFERDNTGAYVGERWGQDLARRYGERGERQVEFSPDGSIKMSPEDGRSFTLSVSMGELDRLNKEGGQKAGDWGLEHVAATIEDFCAKLKTEDGKGVPFEIYRADSNTFAVELRGADARSVRALRKQLAGYRGVSERMEKAGIGPEKAPPLAVSELPHTKTLAALDGFFKGRRAAGGAETGESAVPDGKTAERAMVDVIRRPALTTRKSRST